LRPDVCADGRGKREKSAWKLSSERTEYARGRPSSEREEEYARGGLSIGTGVCERRVEAK